MPLPPSYYPEIFSDGSGGFVAAWHTYTFSWINDSYKVDYKVFAQRFDATKNALWGDNGTAVSTSSDDHVYPRIVSDDSGGYIVTWQGAPTLLTQKGKISAQRMDAYGNRLWSNEGKVVGTGTYEMGYVPSYNTAPDGAGGAIIAWPDNHYGDNYKGGVYNYDILAQRINPSGETLWASGGLRVASSNAAYRSPVVQVVPDGSGGAIVFWEHYLIYGSGLKENLLAQHIDASGNLLWPDTGVEVVSGISYDVWGRELVIVSDGAGGAIVFFNLEQYSASKGYSSGLFAQRVTAQGRVLWPGGVAISRSYDVDERIHAVADSSGGAIVTWSNERGHIFAQRIDGSGKVEWKTGGVHVARSHDRLGYAVEPVLVSDGSGGAIISWQHDHYHVDGFDFFVQRVDSSGKLMWQSGGVDLGNQNGPAGKIESNLALVNGSPGNALLIMWQYSRSGYSHLFTVVPVPIVERLDVPTPYTIYIKNARDWAIGLVLTGFVLASVIYMALRLREKLEENARLRWLAMLFLLAADVSFVFSMLAHQNLTLDVAVLTGILVIVSVIVWKAPFTGGIVAVAAAPLLLLSLAFMNGNLPFGRVYWLYHFLVITLLVVGGALSIVWGRRQRQGLNAYPQFAIASMVVGFLSWLALVAWFAEACEASLASLSADWFSSEYSAPTTWVLHPHVLIFLLAFSVTSVAFVCGIIGLKSNLKAIGISGIVLCSLALIPLVLFGLSEYAWLLGI